MGLVERVVREGNEDLPQRRYRRLAVAVRSHAIAEGDELLLEDLLLLLAHGTSQQVSVAERVPGQFLGYRHDLLLVHDEAVCVAEDLGQRLFELRVNRHDRLAAVLSIGVVVVGVRAHRPRTVEGKHSRDVLEVIGLHRPQERTHRPAVELEHPERVARCEKGIGGCVFERQILQDDRLPAVGGDIAQAVVEDGEVAQPEEVHLQQTERLAGPHVELRDDRAILLAPPDGDDIDQGLAAQDDAGSVDARLPLQALEPTGRVDDSLGIGIALVEVPELGGLGVPAVLGVEDAGQ